MKRSKIFLVATTGLLAVVGFISAKAHRHFSQLSFYTNSSLSSGFCTVLASDNDATTVDNQTPQVGVTQYSRLCNGKPVYIGEK